MSGGRARRSSSRRGSELPGLPVENPAVREDDRGAARGHSSLDAVARAAPTRTDDYARRRLRPQRQRELEARVGVLEALAEELAQLGDAVAHGLRMDVQLAGHARDLPGMVEPGAQRRAQAPARAGAQVVERRQGARGEVGRERAVAGVQQQGGQVLVGHHERAAADAAVERPGRARRGRARG